MRDATEPTRARIRKSKRATKFTTTIITTSIRTKTTSDGISRKGTSTFGATSRNGGINNTCINVTLRDSILLTIELSNHVQ